MTPRAGQKIRMMRALLRGKWFHVLFVGHASARRYLLKYAARKHSMHPWPAKTPGELVI